MFLLRLILIPISFVYALVIGVRNIFYKFGILGTTEFDIPIILVGNLSFGGTGKTPHIEYIIRLLHEKYKLAVLSRGYRRITKGYVFANDTVDASIIGDEPFQIKNKFKDIAVAVCENRVIGVPELLSDSPETNIILMDDGFQHRAIKAGMNILLTDYSRLFFKDYTAPSGTLREFRSAYKRAQIIIVTKCPIDLNSDVQQKIISNIAPLASQKVFFTYQTYDAPLPLFDEKLIADKNADVLLFAGIANTYTLEEYLQKEFKSLTTVRFADHKNYSEIVLNAILDKFQQMYSENKILITTEKDAVKLRKPQFADILKNIPIFYQPMKIEFFIPYKSEFDNQILDYVSNKSYQ